MGLRSLGHSRPGVRVGGSRAYQTTRTIEFQDNRGTDACTTYFFRVRGTITSGPSPGSNHAPDYTVGDDGDGDAAIGTVARGGSDVWEFEGELLQVETEPTVPPTVLLDGAVIEPASFNDVGEETTNGGSNGGTDGGTNGGSNGGTDGGTNGDETTASGIPLWALGAGAAVGGIALGRSSKKKKK